MKRLRTERLLLRPRLEADAARVHRIVSEWDVVRWTATWPWPADFAFTEERMRADQPEQGLFASILLDGSVIGLASLSEAALGYLIAPEAWGRGYATEACATLIDYGFTTTDWPEITATVHKGNLGSRKVLGKLGFRVTGESTGFSRAQSGPLERLDLSLSRQRWRDTVCNLGSHR
jgi:RimJ/RimL family protein N-acetyltransferase